MIILVTGTPGSGKSLYSVWEFLNKQFKGRPLYINGIPDLLIEHEPMTDEDVENWYDGRVPQNAVICIDEVQRIWRPRSASVKPPRHITELEIHRHKGIDFVIITQHPQQMDSHVRRLVGRHIHIRRTWGLPAAVVYEWDSCSNLSALKTAQSKTWKYPKAAYKLYKSSQLHTKAGGSVPWVVWILLAAILAFPLVGWQATQRVLNRFTDSTGAAQQTVEKNGPNAQNQAFPVQSGGQQTKQPLTAAEYEQLYRPRFDGIQHTAPAYDELTKVQTVPLPAACIESKKSDWVQKMGGTCGCFTQTGSRYQTTQEFCVQVVKNLIFLPFQALQQSQPVQVAQVEPQQSQQLAQPAHLLIGSAGSTPAKSK